MAALSDTEMLLFALFCYQTNKGRKRRVLSNPFPERIGESQADKCPYHTCLLYPHV